MKTKDRNIPDGRSVLVLVEGTEDLYTLSNYTGKHPDPAVTDAFKSIHFFPFAQAKVRERLGQNALVNALQALPTFPGFQNVKAVAVICDADKVSPGGVSAKAATTAHIRSALQSVGWQVPNSAGQWISNSSPGGPKWVGFLVVPPNRDSGCLETMLWEAVSNEVKDLKSCAEGLLRCAEPFYAKRFPERVKQPNHENWRDKVRIHALLAGSEEPQTHTTNATLKGYWNFEAEGLAAVLAFLREGQQRSLET